MSPMRSTSAAFELCPWCNHAGGRLLQPPRRNWRRYMDGVISPLHFMRGLGMVGATVIVQAITQIALTRLLEKLPAPGRGRHLDHYGVAYVLVAVFILMMGMAGEITLWALLYYLWGELGGFTNSVYFSLASFTTVGASDLALSPAHRMVG